MTNAVQTNVTTMLKLIYLDKIPQNSVKKMSVENGQTFISFWNEDQGQFGGSQFPFKQCEKNVVT